MALNEHSRHPPAELAAMRPPAPGGEPPVAVADIRVALVAGPRLTGSLSKLCEVCEVPAEWSREWLQETRPHFALVEAGGPAGDATPGWSDDRVRALIDRCGEIGLATGIWVLDGPSANTTSDSILASVDRVFAPDPATVQALRGRLSQPAVMLPHAASASALGASAGAGAGAGGEIAYFGGYAAQWPASARDLVDRVFDSAAPLGLRIMARTEAEVDDLPERYRLLVRAAPTDALVAEALSSCRLSIDYQPDGGVTQTTFDALALGTPVISPRNHVAKRVVPKLVTYPSSAEAVAAELRRSLDPDPEREKRSAEGRRGIRNAHTYGHRLATIASALGYRVLPASDAG